MKTIIMYIIIVYRKIICNILKYNLLFQIFLKVHVSTSLLQVHYKHQIYSKYIQSLNKQLYISIKITKNKDLLIIKSLQ